MAKAVQPLLAVALGVAWAASIGLGARALLRYENTPGTTAEAPRIWPRQSRIVRPASRFALVLFAHPDCPCTRASLGELERLMARLDGRLAGFVRFRKPHATLHSIEAGELWRKANSIPGVVASLDATGADTSIFAARSSGQTLLYDPEGRLVFSGGITAARGHAGDNPGAEAIFNLVHLPLVHLASGHGGPAPAHTPVFGCSLRNPDSAALKVDSTWRKR